MKKIIISTILKYVISTCEYTEKFHKPANNLKDLTTSSNWVSKTFEVGDVCNPITDSVCAASAIFLIEKALKFTSGVGSSAFINSDILKYELNFPATNLAISSN